MEVSEIHICTYPPGGPGITKLKVAFGDVDRTKSYILRSATGLDPEEIISQYYGSTGGSKPTMKERVVTLLLNLNPQYARGETVSMLRENIYKALSYGQRAKLQLKFVDSLGAEIASLFGTMEKVEAGIFSKEPQAQLTFNCKDAFLRYSSYITLPGPFTGSEFLWTDNLSNAPHGYILSFKFLTGGTPFTLINHTEFGDAPFYVNYNFFDNDVLTICSEEGAKSVSLTRPLAGDINLANFIDPLSIWPEMYPGSNRLTFSTDAASGSTIQHRPSYWGV